jgi:diaminopimelate decarboxylase
MAEALAAGLLLFNVESAEELEALDAVGRALGKKAPFAVRVNPDVDAKTHRHIATGLQTSKFGVPLEEAAALYAKSKRLPGVEARGVDCHIGSQMTSLAPLRQAVRKVSDFFLAQREQGHALAYLDLGGGLGIAYQDEEPPSAKAYAEEVSVASRRTGARLILEPGRSLVGNAGILLTRVLYRKKTEQRRFVVVDAGMNDLLRPALYEAHHEIQPVRAHPGRREPVDVVGPVCESTDVLAKDRPLPIPEQGDLWAIRSAGAYGMSMASSYNSRPRPAEVLVQGAAYRVIRARETLEDLWRGESL